MTRPTKLSLIIPAFNEEAGIKSAVLRNREVLTAAGLPFELIIIDDGSRDNTRQIVEDNFAGLPDTRFHSKANGGFGSALRKGIELSTGDYITYAPVDSPLTRDVLVAFLAHIGQGDVLVSYRVTRRGYSPRMQLNSWVYQKLISLLFNMSLTDYNWIHFYPRKIFDAGLKIENNHIFVCAEVLIKAKRLGFTFCEFPVEMQAREGGAQTAASWRAGLRALKDMFEFFLKAPR
jgi:glycosyltransferase involved in cell wall biosynthesis